MVGKIDFVRECNLTKLKRNQWKVYVERLTILLPELFPSNETNIFI